MDWLFWWFFTLTDGLIEMKSQIKMYLFSIMIASVRKFKLTNRRNWIIELNWTNVCFRINGGVSIPMTSLLFFIRLVYFFLYATSKVLQAWLLLYFGIQRKSIFLRKGDTPTQVYRDLNGGVKWLDDLALWREFRSSPILARVY